jgi:hypothetical protein
MVGISRATVTQQKGTREAIELENKIQQFFADDYSVSENGKEKIYTIHSDSLKKVLWNDYFNSS